MTLASYQAPSREIKVGETAVKFRGLSFSDLEVILTVGQDDAEALFSLLDQTMGDTANMDEKATTWLAVSTVKMFPKVAQLVIALSAVEDTDFEDRLKSASVIPLPVQVNLLMEIGKMTFEEVGGIKKFFASLPFLTNAMRQPVTQKKTVKKAA